MNTVAIIIPTYKNRLNNDEFFSLHRCQKVLNNYPIIFVAPNGLQADYMQNYYTIYFQERYFQNLKGYNSLMLSDEFYKTFDNYKFILIYQLDAFVFKDELEYWCNQDLDYIGAAWVFKNSFIIDEYIKNFKAKNYLKKLAGKQNYNQDLKLGLLTHKKVGNGGFSLRKVSKFVQITEIYKDWIAKIIQNNIPEDVFWGILLNLYQPNLIKVGCYRQAIKFAFEMHPSYAYKLNHYKLPFGCHDFIDWEPNFWKEIMSYI